MGEQRTITLSDGSQKYILTTTSKNNNTSAILNSHLRRITPEFAKLTYDSSNKLFIVTDYIYLEDSVSIKIHFFLNEDAMPVGLVSVDFYNEQEIIQFADATDFKTNYRYFKEELRNRLRLRFNKDNKLKLKNSFDIAKYQISKK